MLPTPSTSHISFDNIYEPAEDSFLLLDTLSSASETTFLQQRFPHTSPCPLILEIGTGSGVVLAFVTANSTHILGHSYALTLGVDVNEFACKATTETVKRAVNKSSAAYMDAVRGDLAASLKPESVDVLIFNPPYVPTEAAPKLESEQHLSVFDQDSYLLSLSYAGGLDGMEITNRLLSQIREVLSRRGVAYILLCAQNRPQDILDRIAAWDGWVAERVSASGKTAGWEKLCVIRIWAS